MKKSKSPSISQVLTIICFLFLISPLYFGCVPQKSSEDEGAVLQKADEAVAAQDWGKAIEIFTQALEESPNVSFYYGRSGAYLAKGKESYILAKAMADQGEEPEKASEMAAKSDEEFRLASEDAQKVLEIDPNHSEAYYILGSIALYQADWNGAIDAFSNVIKIDPNNAEAYQRRGEVYGHINNWENEIEDLKKAAELGYVSDLDDSEE